VLRNLTLCGAHLAEPYNCSVTALTGNLHRLTGTTRGYCRWLTYPANQLGKGGPQLFVSLLKSLALCLGGLPLCLVAFSGRGPIGNISLELQELAVNFVLQVGHSVREGQPLLAGLYQFGVYRAVKRTG
jgi:hypothetical protein